MKVTTLNDETLLLFSENGVILVPVVLSQYTRVADERLTDDISCDNMENYNAWAKLY